MLMPTETDYAPNQNQTKPNQIKAVGLLCSFFGLWLWWRANAMVLVVYTAAMDGHEICVGNANSISFVINHQTILSIMI